MHEFLQLANMLAGQRHDCNLPGLSLQLLYMARLRQP
jgi:hypothetical protein